MDCHFLAGGSSSRPGHVPALCHVRYHIQTRCWKLEHICNHFPQCYPRQRYIYDHRTAHLRLHTEGRLITVFWKLLLIITLHAYILVIELRLLITVLLELTVPICVNILVISSVSDAALAFSDRVLA